MQETESTFTATLDVADRLTAEALILDLDGFEGPLDLLLSLSRSQKVDLLQISILDLAEQYLLFVETAKELRIELAADYLVMAAWLAFLKSRLLLPQDEVEEGPTAQQLGAYLAFQLERLQAMRNAAAQLMARNQKGRDFFVRGLTEKYAMKRKIVYTATLLDLMQGYSRTRMKDEFRPLTIDRKNIFTMQEALDKMRHMIGFDGTWTDLERYIPDDWCSDPVRWRSAKAAHFVASLELVKAGHIKIRQKDAFGRIELKRKTEL